jgi:hypothetical protein
LNVIDKPVGHGTFLLAGMGLFLGLRSYRKNPCGFFLEILLESVTAAIFENAILDSFCTS